MNKLGFIVLINLSVCGYEILAIDENSYEFLMPNIHPAHDELYACTQILIRDNFNIVGFESRVPKETPHHVMLYGCWEPESKENVWACQLRRHKTYDSEASPCRTGSQVLFVWTAYDERAALRLPKDVGIRIGPDSLIKYLVLQVRYLYRYPVGKTDNSGVLVNYTKQHMPRQAGLLLLGTSGGVIRSKKWASMETACPILEDKTIHPIAFRTHSHTLGIAVSGYVVRQGVKADSWSLLGKIDPQLPQKFYAVVDARPIQMGDTLAIRCTMYNRLNFDVKIGNSNMDETCHFYLLYWVAKGSPPLEKKYCVSPGPPSYYWTRDIASFQHIPDKEASTLAT